MGDSAALRDLGKRVVDPVASHFAGFQPGSRRSAIPGLWPVVAAMLLLLVAGIIVPDRRLALVLLTVGLTLGCLMVIVAAMARRETVRVQSEVEQIARFVEHDASPSFGTDADGQILHQNRAATDRFGREAGATLARRLGDLFASPSAVLYRLQSRALAVGAAREDVVTRRGHVRLAVHLVGEGNFLWRLEEMTDRSPVGRGAETLCLPMLTASRTGTILFMNEALRHLAGGRVKTLDDLFTTLPLVSGQETEVRGASGLVRCIVADLEGSGGRREVFLLPVGLGPVGPAPDPASFESIPVAVMRLGPLGEIRSANRAARDLLKLCPDEDVRLGDLVEGPGRPLVDWLADALAGRCNGRPEVLRGRRGGGDSFLHVSLRPAPDPEAGGTGLLAVLSDATTLKSLEAQVLQSQKMQAVGQLAGGVAHDFNNLLTAIAGHCDLLLMRHDPGDPDFADLQQIRQNTNRAASVVGQLLAFSRKQTLTPEVLEISDLLGELTHLLNRLVGERVTLRFLSDSGVPAIRADRRQLEQVIVNLVVNARDAMPKGGEIRIETESVDLTADARRDRTVMPAGRYAVIRVCDSGTGIPPENLNRIFEPFFTTKRPGEGTGLGLSTAYGIVKQTGGFIFADSRPGKGTEFSLWFAAHGAEPGRRAAGRPSLPTLAGRPRLGRGPMAAAGRGAGAAARPSLMRQPSRPGPVASDETEVPFESGLDGGGAPVPAPTASAPALPPTAPAPQPDETAAVPANPTPASSADSPHPEADPKAEAATSGIGETVEALLARIASHAPAGTRRAVADSTPAPRLEPEPASNRATPSLRIRTAGPTPPAGHAEKSGSGDCTDRTEAGTPAPADTPADARNWAHSRERDHTPDRRLDRDRDHARVRNETAPGATAATGRGAPGGATGSDAPVVLLVEDEAPVRAFASRALRLHGYTVIEAASAEDALETLRDPALHVDLFLTDVVMPGLDGPGWVREALQTRPDVRVIFMSGYAEDALAEARMQIDGALFLPKPFTLSELTDIVGTQFA